MNKLSLWTLLGLALVTSSGCGPWEQTEVFTGTVTVPPGLNAEFRDTDGSLGAWSSGDATLDYAGGSVTLHAGGKAYLFNLRGEGPDELKNVALEAGASDTGQGVSMTLTAQDSIDSVRTTVRMESCTLLCQGTSSGRMTAENCEGRREVEEEVTTTRRTVRVEWDVPARAVFEGSRTFSEARRISEGFCYLR